MECEPRMAADTGVREVVVVEEEEEEEEEEEGEEDGEELLASLSAEPVRARFDGRDSTSASFASSSATRFFNASSVLDMVFSGFFFFGV